jgi:hypothetical protein
VLGNDGNNYDIFSRTRDDGCLSYQVITGCEYNTNVCNFADGNWHHIVFVSESSSSGTRAIVYEDGIQKYEGGRGACGRKYNSVQGDYSLKFGFGSNIDLFSGAVDEVSVWNKALSASEVSDLYNSGNGKEVCSSVVPQTCTENWTCSSWSNCSNSQQTRTCIDNNACNTTTNKPALTQSCVVSNVNPSQTINTTSVAANISTTTLTVSNQTNISTQIVCPNVVSPSCADGSLVQRGVDVNGCQLAPVCVANNISSNTETENGITTTNTPSTCNGCLFNNTCIPIGYRFDDNEVNSYCDISGIQAQKVNTENITQSCQNNFECETNLCSSGECVAASGLKAGLIKLICRIVNPLSTEEYDSCVNEYVYGVSTSTSQNDASLIQGTGTITINDTEVTGIGTNFLSDIQPGDEIVFTAANGKQTTVVVAGVQSDTKMTLQQPVADGWVDRITKWFKKMGYYCQESAIGTIIYLNEKGKGEVAPRECTSSGKGIIVRSCSGTNLIEETGDCRKGYVCDSRKKECGCPSDSAAECKPGDVADCNYWTGAQYVAGITTCGDGENSISCEWGSCILKPCTPIKTACAPGETGSTYDNCGNLIVCNNPSPSCGLCQRLDEKGICVADSTLPGCELPSCSNGGIPSSDPICSGGCTSSGCVSCNYNGCEYTEACNYLCSTINNCGNQVCSSDSCIDGVCA